MCGIAGFIKLNGSATPAVKRVALKLLHGIAERGDKATGYAFVSERELKVVKEGIGVQEFIKQYEQEITRDVNEAQVWIAHSRFPTKGSIKHPINNHPLFTKGGLAIVHNGVIHNTDEVFKHFKLGRDGEVDSEIILKLIEHQRTATAHTGKAIAQAVKFLDGNLTFALIDEAKPSEVWLHRWGGSAPVSVVVLEGLVVFASELHHALKAVGEQKRGFFRVPTCKVRTLKNGELLCLSGEDIKSIKTDPESKAIEYSAWGEGWGIQRKVGDPDDNEAFYQAGLRGDPYPYDPLMGEVEELDLI
ncbi:MAG: hypothetical protein HWN51_02360 [Desulfobacterales bacterium]|nr:hypothetical protein [Desulfobacterales bacterium]